MLYSLGASNATQGKPAGVSDKECAAFKEAVSYLEPVKSFVDVGFVHGRRLVGRQRRACYSGERPASQHQECDF